MDPQANYSAVIAIPYAGFPIWRKPFATDLQFPIHQP
jgi:hypothetical protein